MRGRFVPALAVPAVLALAFWAAPASASQRTAPIASAPAPPPPPPEGRAAPAPAPAPARSPAAGRLNVDVRVTRFLQSGGQTRAQGVVTATLAGAGSAPPTGPHRREPQA